MSGLKYSTHVKYSSHFTYSGQSAPVVNPTVIYEIPTSLRILAYNDATSTVDEVRAANDWAGTANLELIGALNRKAGTTGIEFDGVCNRLAGTLDSDGIATLPAKAALSKLAGGAW